MVESVKIDKQGQTLYFDEFDGSDERGFKISVKVSNCTDRFIWVGVNSKNCSYNFMGAEHNDSTGTYDLTVSNIGVYDGITLVVIQENTGYQRSHLGIPG